MTVLFVVPGSAQIAKIQQVVGIKLDVREGKFDILCLILIVLSWESLHKSIDKWVLLSRCCSPFSFPLNTF